MKYIITDQGEVRTGGMYHADMGRDCEGEVVRAGHYNQKQDGSFVVFGRSEGYNIESQQEDAIILLNNNIKNL